MNKFTKQFIFVAIGVAIIAAGGVAIYAVNNRGAAPVAWLKFDEGQGATTYDASGNANNGAITGATWQNEDMCKTGKCLFFDGANDAVSVANTVSVKTISFWARPASSTDNILELINNSAYIAMASGVVTTTGFTSPSVYVNGVLNGTLTANVWSFVEITTATAISATGLNIGEANSNFFQGFIDDIKFYDYARSASQIKSDFVGKATPKGASVILNSSEESQAASEGLVGYWKMDEASWAGVASEVVDSSGNANHGTAAGGATKANTTSTAKFGLAGSFDGVDDYVSVGDKDVFSFGDSLADKPFTVSAWVKMTDATDFKIITKNTDTSDGTAEWLFDTNSTDYLRFVLYDNVTTASIRVTSNSTLTSYQNQWVYLTGTYNGNGNSNGITLYLNGAVLAGTVTGGSYTAMHNTATPVEIGSVLSTNVTYKKFANGQIDDVKIYSKARTAEQVRRDYDSGPPPVAQWKMDENTGQYAYDTSGNANTGTLGSASSADSADPSWTSGKYGSALKFDGSNDYVKNSAVSSNISNANNITVALWAKQTTPTLGKSIIGIYNSAINQQNAFFKTITSGTIYMRFGIYSDVPTVYIAMDTTPMDTNWHFWTGTFDGANVKLYKDGVLVATTPAAVSLYKTNISSMVVGLLNGGDTSFWNGTIDDVRIYNYARTQKQIMEDMSSRNSVSGSGNRVSATGYWSFDEGAGDTAYDKSVNANNGDLYGSCPGAATCPTWTPNGKFGKALSFDGGDYVEVGDPANGSLDFTGSDSFSVSTWIKTSTDFSDNAAIINKFTSGNNPGYILFVQASNENVNFTIGDTGGTPGVANGSSVSDGAWHHIVGVRDVAADKLYIYVDGVQKNSAVDTTTGTQENSRPLYIGQRDGVSGSFNGLIDEVKIYPFALSPAEIKEEFNRGASLKLGSSAGPPTSGVGTSSDSAALEYCVPGDASACAAPVARWKMDEKTGQYANDISSSQNVGTLGTGSGVDASDPVWKSAASCHSGSCLKFDGSNDYVGVNRAVIGNENSFTLEAWLKPSTPMGGDFIENIYRGAWGSDRYGYEVEVGGTGLITFTTVGTSKNDNSITSLSGITAGQWSHVVAIRDLNANTLAIYINGVLNKSAGASYSGALDKNILNFGGYYSPSPGSSYYFNGLIDDIRIYNYARTAAQVAYDYNRGAPIAHWQMNDGQDTATTCDGTGTVVKDSSGNNNTGTLTLGATPTPANAWSEAKYGCGLTLDGTDDYVSVANSASLNIGTNAITISAWVKRLVTDTSRDNIITKFKTSPETRDWQLQSYENKPSLLFYFTDATNREIQATTIFDITKWYHIVATYDGSIGRIYVNGIQENSYTSNKTLLNTADGNSTVKLGTLAGTVEFWNGFIDDVRIYNYALTAQQVKTVFNQGAAVRFGPTEGLP